MRRVRFATLIAVAGSALCGTSVFAQGKSGQGNAFGQSPTVYGAQVDAERRFLNIDGFAFNCIAPQVWLSDAQLPVIGCTTRSVRAYLGPTLPASGTYRVTIVTGAGKFKARLDVTIGTNGPSGAAGSKGAQGPMGPQGPAGPAGPQGAAGPPGPAGAQGPTGPAGPAGAIGPAGPAGPQGPKGDTGAAGAVGPQGLQGPQGDTGATGATGAQGPKGDTGATGPQGPKGDKGDTGATGAVGPQGPQGLQGIAGATGAQGPKGDKGDKGDTGATGAAGPQGPAGVDGLPGAQGPKGDTGPAGPAGPAGAVLLAQRSWTNYTLNSTVDWVPVNGSGFQITTKGGALLVTGSLALTGVMGSTSACAPFLNGVWAGVAGGLPDSSTSAYPEGALNTSAGFTPWNVSRVYPGIPAGTYNFEFRCTSDHFNLAVNTASATSWVSVLELK